MEDGLPHLDKFAVSDDAQGEGLGRAAWQVMRAEHPQLFWRSRPGNAINEFYLSESDGHMKGERWNVFWYGLESFEQVQYAVDHQVGVGLHETVHDLDRHGAFKSEVGA